MLGRTLHQWNVPLTDMQQTMTTTNNSYIFIRIVYLINKCIDKNYKRTSDFVVIVVVAVVVCCCLSI